MKWAGFDPEKRTIIAWLIDWLIRKEKQLPMMEFVQTCFFKFTGCLQQPAKRRVIIGFSPAHFHSFDWEELFFWPTGQLSFISNSFNASSMSGVAILRNNLFRCFGIFNVSQVVSSLFHCHFMQANHFQCNEVSTIFIVSRSSSTYIGCGVCSPPSFIYPEKGFKMYKYKMIYNKNV